MGYHALVQLVDDRSVMGMGNCHGHEGLVHKLAHWRSVQPEKTGLIPGNGVGR